MYKQNTFKQRNKHKNKIQVDFSKWNVDDELNYVLTHPYTKYKTQIFIHTKSQTQTYVPTNAITWILSNIIAIFEEQEKATSSSNNNNENHKNNNHN